MANITTITQTANGQYITTIPRGIAEGLLWKDKQQIEWVIINKNQLMLKKKDEV